MASGIPNRNWTKTEVKIPTTVAMYKRRMYPMNGMQSIYSRRNLNSFFRSCVPVGKTFVQLFF